MTILEAIAPRTERARRLFEAPAGLSMLIDGEWCAAADGATLPTHDPATGRVLAYIPDATESDVDRAVGAARPGVGWW